MQALASLHNTPIMTSRGACTYSLQSSCTAGSSPWRLNKCKRNPLVSVKPADNDYKTILSKTTKLGKTRQLSWVTKAIFMYICKRVTLGNSSWRRTHIHIKPGKNLLLQQRWQLCGLQSECVLTWRDRLEACGNSCPQTGQLKFALNSLCLCSTCPVTSHTIYYCKGVQNRPPPLDR